MQNAIASTTSAATFNAAAFSAQPFASYQAFVPSIKLKLADIAHPTSVKSAAPTQTKNVVATSKAATVEQIVAKGYELAKMHEKYSEEYVVRGNKALYDVLAAIYEYAVQINASTYKDEIIERMIKVLKNDYSIKTTSKTHWLTTVVKLIVKGTDRQTASNYSRILQVAFDEKLAVNELTNYIVRRGGVANIRTTEAACVAVNNASEIAKARGELVKDYYVNTAVQTLTTIDCDMKPQVWGGDGKKTDEPSKLTTGKFDFFITMNESGNRYRVIEHGVFSEELENQIMRLIAKTFKQSTESMQTELKNIRTTNEKLNKTLASVPTKEV